MFDDNEDDAPVDTDSDFDSGSIEDAVTDEEPETAGAPARRRRAARKKKKKKTKTTKKAAARTRKVTSAKATSSRKAPPGDLTGVKAGAHTLWVSQDLADALTSKDRRKLKALFKRAQKRRKAKK